MIAALNQYAPTVVKGDQYNELGRLGVDRWPAVQEGGRGCQPEPDEHLRGPARWSLLAQHETLGGLTVPLSYAFTGKAAPAFTTSYFLETVKDGAFAPIGDGKAVAIPPADIAAIGKVLQGG